MDYVASTAAVLISQAEAVVRSHSPKNMAVADAFYSRSVNGRRF